MKVYSILGEEVATLVDREQRSGDYTIVWNGKNDFGQDVGSGVYLYRLKAGDFIKIKKMLLVR